MPFVKYVMQRRIPQLLFFMSLEQLTSAGLPLRDSLDIMRTENRGFFQKWLYTCTQKLEEGETLTQILKTSSFLADPVSLSFIRMGEQTGHMRQAFHLVRLHLQQTHILRQQWRKAVRYPCLVFVLMMLTIGALCETLLPALFHFVKEAGGVTSPLAQGLLFLSHGIQKNGVFYLYLLFFSFGFLFIFWFFSHTARFLLERLFLSLPYIGTFYLEITWSRFFSLKSLMIQHNISFFEAFDTAVTLVRETYLQAQLRKARQQILEGHPLATSYQRLPGMTPSALYLLKMVEKTGLLAPTLQHIGEFYRQSSQRRQDTLLTFLEPACLTLLGLFLLLIIGGTLMPLYDQLHTLSALSE